MAILQKLLEKILNLILVCCLGMTEDEGHSSLWCNTVCVRVCERVMTSSFLNFPVFKLSLLLWTNWILTCVAQLHNVMRDYEYVRLQRHVVVIFFFFYVFGCGNKFVTLDSDLQRVVTQRWILVITPVHSHLLLKVMFLFKSYDIKKKKKKQPMLWKCFRFVRRLDISLPPTRCWCNVTERSVFERESFAVILKIY